MTQSKTQSPSESTISTVDDDTSTVESMIKEASMDIVTTKCDGDSSHAAIDDTNAHHHSLSDPTDSADTDISSETTTNSSNTTNNPSNTANNPSTTTVIVSSLETGKEDTAKLTSSGNTEDDKSGGVKGERGETNENTGSELEIDSKLFEDEAIIIGGEVRGEGRDIATGVVETKGMGEEKEEESVAVNNGSVPFDVKEQLVAKMNELKDLVLKTTTKKK